MNGDGELRCSIQKTLIQLLLSIAVGNYVPNRNFPPKIEHGFDELIFPKLISFGGRKSAPITHQMAKVRTFHSFNSQTAFASEIRITFLFVVDIIFHLFSSSHGSTYYTNSIYIFG